MQSILQYRRFERRLREQIDRHGVDKTAGCKTKPDEPNAGEPKNCEAGPPTDVENEKEIQQGSRGDTENDVERDLGKDADVASNDHAEEQLSGSTTRESTSSSESDRPRPTLSTATTRDTNEGSHLGNVGTRLGNAMTGVSVRPRTTNEGGHDKGKVFIVGYAGEKDPLNPQNWSKTRRMAITINVAFVGFIVGFASSVDSAVLEQARKEFHVGEVAESLATGIYLVGFGVGSFFAAPISETVGRNPVYIVTMSLFMIFTMVSFRRPSWTQANNYRQAGWLPTLRRNLFFVSLLDFSGVRH